MQKYLEQYGIDPKYIKAKYFLDRIFAIIIFIFLLPIFVIISLIIVSCIQENPFFTCFRAGKNNRKFKLFKFKSMRTIYSGKVSKITIEKDKRIYTFGKIMRDTKIDELPQLINIIRGEMSFVGPRPEDVKIVNNFFEKKEFDTLLLKPGLASPGSIFNYIYIDKRLLSESDYINKYLPLKLSLEIRYLSKVSFLYDLKIIFKTIILIIFLKFFRSFPERISEYRYL